MIWSIAVAILILGIMVLVHELGHFLTARRLGLKVNEFGIGMGPKMKKWERDGIIYSLRIIPIGGFVSFYGEDEALSDPDAFNNQKPWKRILTILAGPLANILFAFLVTVCLLMTVGELVPTIDAVQEGYPAQEIGIQVGDRIVRVNDKDVNFATEAQLEIMQSEQDSVKIVVDRNGELLEYQSGCEYVEFTNGSIGKVIGVKFDETKQKYGFFEAIALSFEWISFIIRQMLAVIGGLFVGTQSTQALVGPVGTISAIGETAQISFYSLMQLTVLLSINLGIVNLIPFPALDGSRIVFTVIEWIRGKPISQEKEGKVHFVGFVVLMGLMVLFTYQDIVRLFSGG